MCPIEYMIHTDHKVKGKDIETDINSTAIRISKLLIF